jgi:uncharacterized membrane protein
MALLHKISRSLCAAAYIFAGYNHFANPSIYCKIMPAWIPAHLEMVYISGVFEILGGLGLLIPQTRMIAIWGLLALLVAVYPANINMAMHPDLFPKIPVWVLYLRLPLQFVLMLWVWSCRDKKG